MVLNDSVQRDAVWISPLASIEPMTLTLGGLTALLHEQHSCFKISLPGLDARLDARPPGMRPVADSILKSGTHSWEEIGHEKIYTTIISLPLIQEGQLSVTGERMCTNDTGTLLRRFAREKC